MAWTAHDIYRQIFKIWRKKRFSLFLQILQPSPTDILLDVGGYPGTWLSQPRPVKRIDLLNIHEISVPTENDEFRALLGDGCALTMPDKSYDIGFSNSVIEHVGTWERQQQFASEIRRVAASIWLQTPAYECPIEPHYMTPFVHYFPRSFQKKILSWGTLRGWLERLSPEDIDSMVETTRLLRKSEMIELFPDCEIITERLFGIIPKSYIAFRKGHK